MRRILAAAILLAACEAKTKGLANLYCEGGVVKGRGMGDCLAIMSIDDAGDNGSVVWTKRTESRYALKRVGKDHFHLLLDGVVQGAVEVNGDWINVTFVSETRKYALRSDAPGFLN